MILLRQRGALFEAIVKALKDADVPVAGRGLVDAGRASGGGGPVVLGRALLLPDDDLTPATALKTPLIDLDDDDLLRPRPPARARCAVVLQAAAAANRAMPPPRRSSSAGRSRPGGKGRSVSSPNCSAPAAGAISRLPGSVPRRAMRPTPSSTPRSIMSVAMALACRLLQHVAGSAADERDLSASRRGPRHDRARFEGP